MRRLLLSAGAFNPGTGCLGHGTGNNLGELRINVQKHLSSLVEIAWGVLPSVYESLCTVHGACQLVLELYHPLQVLLAMQVDVDLFKSL